MIGHKDVDQHNDGMSILAKEYEAYMFQDELIMTHMYGSGVFYWKTSRGGDVDYWEKIINKIEKINEYI